MTLVEIELVVPENLPKLQRAVTVLGNVSSTPRFDIVDEGWVNGEWGRFYADKTLFDRHIADVTSEMAVALSKEPWVVWIAPAKTGTVYDGKTVQWWEVLPPIVTVITSILPAMTPVIAVGAVVGARELQKARIIG